MDNRVQPSSILPLNLASPQHRFGGYALNSAFGLVTFGVGWVLWSLVVWSKGRTPAHQILKMRVYSTKTNEPATWGRMFLRTIIIPLFFSLPLMVYVGLGFWAIADDTHRTLGIFLIIFGYMFAVIMNLLDCLWIFKGEKRQRLIDIFANTVVVNECIRTLPETSVG